MDVASFRHRLIAPLLLTLACACATTQPRPDAPIVKDLEIQGTDQVDEGDIKERILTSETPWWEPLWPFDNGPSYFDPNAWVADQRRIERYYQAQGYYQAEVISDSVEPVGSRGVKVQATVREGEPTRIASIRISGLDELPPEHQRRTAEELPLKEGAIFQEEAWVGVKELLQGRLRELGYAEAEVGGEVQVDVATQEATVELQARPGQRYKFGNIFVATDPNPQVPPRRIIEQAQGAIRKGAWYSDSALASAQARVFRMGVFGAVKVNRGAPDQEAGTVPLVVDVRESKLRSVRLGAGVGVDSARQEGRLLAEWTNRNFFGGLRRLTVKGRVGYAFLPSLFATLREGEEDPTRTRSGLIFNASTEFEQPRFLFRDVSLQASLSGEKGLELAYSFVGGRLRSGLGWRPHPDLTVTPSYNLEVYRLNGQVGADEAVPALTLGCEEPVCTIALSYLEGTVVWERRNDPLRPRSGYYAALSVQGGGGPLQGSFTYLRALPDLRYYYTPGEQQRLTLAAKLRVGTLIPYRSDQTVMGEPQSSIVTRFFSGGSSMRGFNSRRLSPLIAVSLEDPDDDPSTPETPALLLPVGGNSLLETSLEARYQMTENLVVATFWDTGSVGQERLSFSGTSPFDNLYHAVGVGLRYLTIVGPVRLDFAWRLNIGDPLPVQGAPPTYSPSASCFGLGDGKVNYAGAPEGICTLHLSIGEAF